MTPTIGDVKKLLLQRYFEKYSIFGIGGAEDKIFIFHEEELSGSLKEEIDSMAKPYPVVYIMLKQLTVPMIAAD